jgi:hypothetical protein
MIEPGKHKMTEAMAGQTPAPGNAEGGHHGAPQPTGSEVAEETRRAQESQNNGKNDLDRDSHLTQIGRGQQTHG